ncbi:hypothetical protein EV667_3030 [Ancylobacter aquaticus]|uniref:Uncharacterized protein n=1 Tax=Ancylobacter aquaticus TaxID=100 RepID=A0A4R1IE12_ANCAQ|nr:hypothetical protein [Ancylobacter aquaticus]TCK29012.1 hypothetical protein EV667_3030 [Ancylobacter aquaticus]
MTQAELIAALPEGRLPPALMQVNATDLLALFGAGLLLAALLALLAAPFLARRPSRRALIRATRGMPPQERVLAIGRLLGHLPEELRALAYGGGPPLAPEAIERIALKASERIALKARRARR